MEHRLHFENDINNKIKELNHYNKKDHAKIERFSDSTDPYCIKHLEISKASIQERDEQIEEYKKDLLLCRQGKLDDRFKYERYKNQQEAAERRAEKLEKYRAASEDKKNKELELKQYYKRQREEDRRHRTCKKEADRSYRYYQNVTGSIPEHLLRKLKDMPNNKGFIYKGRGFTFRGVEITGDNYIYGQKPAEKGKPLTMFERNRNVMYIHEWSDTCYKRYEKVGKNRKQLVEHTIRNKKT